MPSLLHYDIVTGPTSLQVSQPGAPSVGAVYVIVSNPGADKVGLQSLEVKVPVGNGPGDLTPHPDRAETSFEISSPLSNPPKFIWNGQQGAFQLTISPGWSLGLDPGDSMVLKLENVTVSAAEGLALLTIHELSHSYGGKGGMKNDASRTVTVGLLKNAQKVPHNFRPDKAMVDVDAGENVTLLWEGPNNIEYWISYPGATPEHFPAAPPGTPVAQKSFSWKADPVPKRGTTYTLMAGTGPGQPQGQGYIFTTTVHASIPEFKSGVRTPWLEGTPYKGRVTFTPQGVDINKDGGGLGTVTADEARLTTALRTKRVWGLGNSDGWVEFPQDGIKAGIGAGSDLGTVTADKVSANGVNTEWVGERDTGKGWIGFPQSGVSVYKDGKQERGTVSADKADVNRVITRSAEGPDGKKSRISFTETGVKITDPDGHRGTVVAGETNVRSVVTPWVSGPQEGAGWLSFQNEGVDVYRDGQVAFGRIRYASYEEVSPNKGTGRPLHRRLPPYDWPPRQNN